MDVETDKSRSEKIRAWYLNLFPGQEIEALFRRDRFMNALEAKTYGFIDEVLGDTANLIKMNTKNSDVSFYSE